MKRISIFIICFVVLSVFIYNIINIPKSNDNTKFEIYLVADNAISAIKNKNIDDIPIEQTPIITDKDIEKYIWNEHKIILAKKTPYPDSLSGTSHKFFITVVDGKRVYLGVFVSLLSSIKPPSDMPLINILSRDKSLSIKFNGDNDPRMDARIKEAFQRLKKLSLYKS
jgi:hypothetical protein